MGGDFYDAWQTGERYFLAIGDVAGHGPAAAALTSLTRQAMRVVSRYEQSPGRILAVVNDTIRAQSAPEQFCTAALAVLRPDRRTATRSRWPAPAIRRPIVVRASGGPVEEIGVCGPLLGVLAEREYDDRECTLGARRPRRVLDGRRDRAPSRTAACSARSACTRCSRGLANRSAGDVARAIDEAVVDFAPGLPDDDVAILDRARHRRPPPATRDRCGSPARAPTRPPRQLGSVPRMIEGPACASCASS